MKTFLGTLKPARFFLQNLVTSGSSMFDPSLGTIAQFICSFRTRRTPQQQFNQKAILILQNLNEFSDGFYLDNEE